MWEIGQVQGHGMFPHMPLTCPTGCLDTQSCAGNSVAFLGDLNVHFKLEKKFLHDLTLVYAVESICANNISRIECIEELTVLRSRM